MELDGGAEYCDGSLLILITEGLLIRETLTKSEDFIYNYGTFLQRKRVQDCPIKEYQLKIDEVVG